MVTEDMKDAGLRVYEAWLEDDAPRLPRRYEANLMAEIFSAMLSVANGSNNPDDFHNAGTPLETGLD